MGKILLYYKYVFIENPKQIAEWMQGLCDSLNLKGRIILAHEGINGTVGGDESSTDAYIEAMNAHPLFGNIDFKDSVGSNNHFPKMSIKVRDEIVALGAGDVSLDNKGEYLTPDQVHTLLDNRPDDLVVIDCRNNYESRIGHFKGAIKPNVQNFRDFPKYVDENIENLKDKQVFMYCTGGIRCEKASAYVKEKGVEKVYHLEGGIHRYAEKYPNGHFRGQNYVFDDRIIQKVNDDILDNCDVCSKPFDEVTNCKNCMCNKQFLVCQDCKVKLDNACGEKCLELLSAGKVKARKVYRKCNTISH